MSISDKVKSVFDLSEMEIKGIVRVQKHLAETGELTYDSGEMENDFVGQQVLLEILRSSVNGILNSMQIDTSAFSSIRLNLSAPNYTYDRYYGLLVLSNDTREPSDYQGGVAIDTSILGACGLSDGFGTYVGPSLVRGNINDLESGKDIDTKTITIVADFPTSACNGTFQAVSLAPVWYGERVDSETNRITSWPDGYLPIASPVLHNLRKGLMKCTELVEKFGVSPATSASYYSGYAYYLGSKRNCFAGIVPDGTGLYVQGENCRILDLATGLFGDQFTLKNEAGVPTSFNFARIIGTKLYAKSVDASNIWHVWDISNYLGNAIAVLDFGFLGKTRIDGLGVSSVPNVYYLYSSDTTVDGAVNKPTNEIIYKVNYTTQEVLQRLQGEAGSGYSGHNTGSCQIFEDWDNPNIVCVSFGNLGHSNSSSSTTRIYDWVKGAIPFRQRIYPSYYGSFKFIPIFVFDTEVSSLYQNISIVKSNRIPYSKRGNTGGNSSNNEAFVWNYSPYGQHWFDYTKKSLWYADVWYNWGDWYSGTGIENAKGYEGVYEQPLNIGVMNKVVLPSPVTKVSTETLKVTYKLIVPDNFNLVEFL